MKKSSFVEGTLIATLAIIFTKILGMIYVIPFYAIVGVQGSALYAYAYNIYNIFLDISSAGLPIAISKIINEYNTLGMMDAKVRAYHIGKKLMGFIAITIFIMLFLFAPQIAHLLIGNLKGGNTISDVSFAIRCVSFAILIVPFLSVEKGYLQGHKVINVSSISQILEQIVRIAVILIGSYLIVKVFNKPVTLAVGVSVFGAFVGGVVAYSYVKYCVCKNKGVLGLDKEYKEDSLTNKEILKKIFAYALPFIIINIVSSCYNFVDMTLLLRTMNYLNFNAKDVEFITSAVATWAPKINMIVTSLAMGMSTSFIPTMVSAYTLKNFKEVNNKFNQAIQILLLISLPMTIGLSLLSREVWSIFYGPSAYGTYILALNVFTGLVINIYMISSSALQGLNKFRIVYLSTIIGFVSNALLDVPLMLLYSKIGIPPFLGAVTSSILGYSLSILIIFVALKKECNLKYTETLNVLFKLIVPVLAMVLSVLLLKLLIPLNIASRLSCIIYVAINALVGGVVYIVIAYKMGIVDSVFGREAVRKITRKLTFRNNSNIL
ncbi:MAG: polysaccharide biosynthesis protein [Bacilli bacterium]|nr:polysaccharide biosynthesis protein [Bacilli bacterium]